MEEGGPPRGGAAIQWVGACFLQGSSQRQTGQTLRRSLQEGSKSPSNVPLMVCDSVSSLLSSLFLMNKKKNKTSLAVFLPVSAYKVEAVSPHVEGRASECITWVDQGDQMSHVTFQPHTVGTLRSGLNTLARKEGSVGGPWECNAVALPSLALQRTHAFQINFKACLVL